MNQVIPLDAALKLMNRTDHADIPVPFTIEFVTADRNRGTGGKWIKVEGAILSKLNKLLPLHLRRSDGFGGSKNPASYENAQRNIQAPDGSITTVHIYLIKRFNGHDIV
jgi:hypothetical protein